MDKSDDIRANAFGRDDGKGRTSRLCLWNYAGDDVTGVVARFVLCAICTKYTTYSGKIGANLS